MEDAVQFFSDLSNQPMEINKSELITKFESCIKSILQKRFPLTEEKQRVETFQKGIRIACPLCGDSLISERKKRGTLYLNSFWFKCYNCGKGVGFDSFLEQFNMQGEFSQSEIYYFKKNVNPESLSSEDKGSSHKFKTTIMSIKGVDQQYGIPREDIMRKLRLEEVTHNKVVYQQLSKRKQIFDDNSHFGYNAKFDNLYIFNLSEDKKKVLGIQIRFGTPPRPGLRFYSYNYKDIWKKVLKEEPKLEDDIIRKLNKLSLYYNIFFINPNQEIFVCESSIDANHLPNSLGVWGASNFISLPKIGYYIYDNSMIDKAGFIAAQKTLNLNYNTFLWRKFIGKYGKFTNCKDINDLFKLETINIKILYEFFSNNPIDLFYI